MSDTDGQKKNPFGNIGCIVAIIFGIFGIIIIFGLLLSSCVGGMSTSTDINYSELTGGGGGNGGATGTGTLTAPDNLNPETAGNCLDEYMKSAVPGAPLIGHGKNFVTSGQQYNVNPALLVAIGQQETSLYANPSRRPAFSGSYNYFNKKGASFSSFESAISEHGRYLGQEYIAAGQITIVQIGNGKNGQGPPNWYVDVVNDHAYCPYDGKNYPESANANWIPGITKLLNAIVAKCPEFANSSNNSNIPTMAGKKIYLHWSAGGHDSSSDDYNYNILGDGSIIKGSGICHTEKRCSADDIGISVSAACGSYDSSHYPSDDIYGTHTFSTNCQITPAQIDTMTELVAKLAKENSFPIDIQHVMTHAEAGADRDFSIDLVKKVSPSGGNPCLSAAYDPPANQLGMPTCNYGPGSWKDGWPGGAGTKWDLWEKGNELRNLSQQKLNQLK